MIILLFLFRQKKVIILLFLKPSCLVIAVVMIVVVVCVLSKCLRKVYDSIIFYIIFYNRLVFNECEKFMQLSNI